MYQFWRYVQSSSAYCETVTLMMFEEIPKYQQCFNYMQFLKYPTKFKNYTAYGQFKIELPNGDHLDEWFVIVDRFQTKIEPPCLASQDLDFCLRRVGPLAHPKPHLYTTVHDIVGRALETNRGTSKPIKLFLELLVLESGRTHPLQWTCCSKLLFHTIWGEYVKSSFNKYMPSWHPRGLRHCEWTSTPILFWPLSMSYISVRIQNHLI